MLYLQGGAPWEAADSTYDIHDHNHHRKAADPVDNKNMS